MRAAGNGATLHCVQSHLNVSNGCYTKAYRTMNPDITSNVIENRNTTSITLVQYDNFSESIRLSAKK